MATLSNLYIYIVDETIYNADPESITLANEGTDYCKIKIKIKWNHTAQGTTEPEPLFANKGIIIKDGVGFEVFSFQGRVESRAEVAYIQNYYKKHLLSGSDDDYICIKYDSNDYYPFSDNTGTNKEIAPGLFSMFDFQESETTPLYYIVKGEFKIVW